MGEPRVHAGCASWRSAQDPLRIVPGRGPEPMSKAWAPEMGQSTVIGTTDCARLGTMPTCSRGDCHGPPRSNRQREGLEALGAVQRLSLIHISEPTRPY